MTYLAIAIVALVLVGCSAKRDIRLECEGWCKFKADTDIDADPDIVPGPGQQARPKLRDKIILERKDQ